MIDGLPYGLNKGYVGFGSDNSRGVPRQHRGPGAAPVHAADDRDFDDGVADLFTGAQRPWAVSAAATTARSPPARPGDVHVDLGLPKGVQANARHRVHGHVKTRRDRRRRLRLYSTTDFKFVAIDAVADRS